MDKDIVVSIKTVLFTVALYVLLTLLVKLGPILALVLISSILVLALEPGVQFFRSKTFMNKPVPRSLAVSLTFILTLVVIVLVLTVGLPPVVSQAQTLLQGLVGVSQNIPGVEVSRFDNFVDLVSKLGGNVGSLSNGVLSVTISVFSNVFTVLSVLVITLYMSLDWVNIKERLFSLFPKNYRDEAKTVFAEIEVSIGHWVKGQILLMLIIGGTSFVGLVLLDVDFPLALALISGLLEIVPMVGPIVAAFLAAIVGFSMSPLKGVAVIALFIIIQQLENNLLVPKVMQKVSGFSPLVILLALLIGSNFFGIVGAIMAVPITMIGVIIFKHVLRHSQK